MDEGQPPEWLVLHYDVVRDAYVEIGCTRAGSADVAFRNLVLHPDQHFGGRFGAYRVLPLEGAGHFAIELNVRDLDQKENPRASV